MAAVTLLSAVTLAATLTAPCPRSSDDRPTVIFAYTVKGHGLPTEGHPQNHSSR
ncbi:hypothetical protein [Streptomyces sp. KL116D]|uniref:hypothetical protein n=1 Tax=Streptomyces sp. KL116D TaxID=3045152 RepID=UPI003557DD36